MLDTLTIDTFLPRQGEPFRLVLAGGGDVSLTLTEVQALGGSTTGRSRTPFSLVFHAPSTTPVLPQRIYRLENEHLPGLELFLVPLGRDERGPRYEAVFT